MAGWRYPKPLKIGSRRIPLSRSLDHELHSGDEYVQWMIQLSCFFIIYNTYVISTEA